jgi:hypothetical protein
MISNALDPMSFFVPLVLTQPDERLRRVPPAREPDSGLAICSARQALLLQRFTAIYGTAQCATHIDVSWRYRAYGSHAGRKPATTGVIRAKGTD